MLHLPGISASLRLRDQAGTAMTDRPEPPRAEPRPFAYEAHGVRIDDP